MNTLSQNKVTIISERVIENIVTVQLNSDNIIEVKWDKTLPEIEKTHILQVRSFIKELGKGKKMPVYFDTYNFMAITPEASAYAVTENSSKFTLANAVLVDILPKKLIFNFFLKINKPIVPTKGFSTKEEAISWLKEQQS